MRKITLICVGNLKEKYWSEAVAEYQKRLNKFFDFKLVEIAECKIEKNNFAEISKALEKESAKILEKASGKIICPMAIEGQQMDSVQFANFVQQNTDNGELCFVIGSSFGLHDSVKSKGKNISFGKNTFPHQMMRVMLLEQIYRAGTIINNIEYHK